MNAGLLRRAGRAAVALGLGIALAEGMLRLLGVAYPPFYREAAIVGNTHMPGAAGWWTEEGETFVRINSDGLRDREHTFAKPPGTLRIAVLGDSYAEAFQVPLEQTFWATLERELSECAGLEGRKVEVINFGVSGYGTAQELLALRHKAWRYDPDLVLLAFLTGNDVRNNSRALQGGNRPYFYRQDGTLRLDRRYTEKRSYRVGTSAVGRACDAVHLHSRLWQVGAALRKAWKRRAKLARASPATASARGELGLDDRVYTAPTDPDWQEAWQVTEDLIRQMDGEVRERGARLAVVTLSNSSQVHPDPAERERFAQAVGADDLYYPDRRIEALAHAESIPFLMLAPPLRAWAERYGTCVHGFDNAVPCGGHWNEHGHRVAGEAIAAALCREAPWPVVRRPR